MNPIDATTPDETEIDPYTGKLKKVELHNNTLIQTGINRNLLYTKAEVDAKINAIPSGGGSSGVSSFNSRTGAVTPQNGDYTVSQVTKAASKSFAIAMGIAL